MIDLRLCNCEECPLFGSGMVVTRRPFISPYNVIYKAVTRNNVFLQHFRIAEVEEIDPVEVLLIGMAPAYEELRQGDFFVGQSGLLLNAVMGQLDYDSYAVSNVLLCRIPEEATQSEINKAADCCFPRLEAQIKEYQPKLLVALGNLPLHTLTGLNIGIMTAEGRVLPSDYGDVLAVQHPAAVLRFPDNYPDFLEALKGGLRWKYGTYKQITDEPNTVVVDENNMADVCQRIENAGLAAIDLETTRTGLNPYGREPDGIRCMAITIEPTTTYIVPGESSPYWPEHPNFINHPALMEVIPKVKGVYHNGQFDCAFMWQTGYRNKMYYDTMIAHQIMDERPRSHGLKVLARKRLGAPDWEHDIKRYLPTGKSSYDLIPDDVLYRYASFDTIATYLLYQQFESETRGTFFDKFLMRAANMFVDLRHTGIRIDPWVLMQADELLEQDLDQKIKELYEIIGHYINPLSWAQVAELLYDELELPQIAGRSTSVDILKRLPYHPAIEKIIEIRQASKLRSTYVLSLIGFMDNDYRVHPTIKLASTVTGRASSEDPSVMTIVRNNNIKKMYLPEDGSLFMEADAKQMEVRWFAIYNQDEVLRKLLNEGDPHDMIRKHILKLTGKDYPRVRVKGAVFGKMYGRGIDSFMAEFGVPADEAQEIINGITELLPTLKQYNDRIEHDIKTLGYLTSYFGRIRRFGLLTKRSFYEALKQGVNFPIQSAASDTNLWTMVHLYENADKFGIVPHFPVHDSVIMSIQDKDMVPLVKKEMETFSQEIVNNEMEFDIEVKIGPNWGETKLLEV